MIFGVFYGGRVFIIFATKDQETMHDILFFDTPDDFKKLNTFVNNLSYTRKFIITDKNTSVNCLPPVHSLFDFTYTEIRLNPGEEFKNLNTVRGIWDTLFRHDADRKSLIINLGGGVITDTGGFAASTFKRGITYINMPTSLLAMVDAALGGKTGINYEGIKNQIGTVYEPERVIIYPGFLKTLPEKEFYSGLAEMFKHGLIADAGYYFQMKHYKREPLMELIRRSVEIKITIVNHDKDDFGLRQLLNFGHTVGHALEAYMQEISRPVTHGHAVAAGMIAEAMISLERAGLPHSAFQDIKNTLSKIYDLSPFREIDINKVRDYMKFDKKNTGGEIKFSLLKEIGTGIYGQTVDKYLIIKSLEYLKTI